MEDLEDGELVEDNDSSLVVKKSNDLWRGDTGVACDSASLNSLARVPSKPACLLRRHSSSDSDSEDGQQPSSDDDYEPGSKKLNVMESCVASDQNSDAKSKKKFNIWGSVLAEQSLAKDLSGWFGVNKKVESDRDVETYDYTSALKDDRPVVGNPCESGGDPLADDSGVFAIANICDIETFGTAAVVKTTTSLPSDDSDGDQLYAAGDSVECNNRRDRNKIHGRKTHPGCSEKASAKERLGVAIDDAAGSSSEAVTVGMQIHRVLSEPKHMIATFVRIVQVIGADKALELLSQTETLEKSGGLKIMNGERRRTPGGVYLYLLKADSGVSKAQYVEIFKEKFEHQKRMQKEAKKRRWTDRSEKIVRQVAMSVDEQPPLVGRKEQYLVAAGKMESSSTVDVKSKETGESRAIGGEGDYELDDTCAVDITLDL